eukprot:1760380-Rhodomonas_salina.1
MDPFLPHTNKLSCPDLNQADRTAPDIGLGTRSGDLGQWVGGSRGERAEEPSTGPVLKVLGRIDLQVKLRGFRIELEEVEAVIKQCVLVRNAAVVLHSTPTDASHSSAANSSAGAPETASSERSRSEADADAASSASSSSRLVAFVEL